jgi:hypothetical protein
MIRLQLEVDAAKITLENTKIGFIYWRGFP